MATRHVFILWSNPLFQEAVARLLDHPDIQFMGSAEMTSAYLAEVRQKHPDAIIFEKSDATTSGELINLLEPEEGSLHLVGFNLEDNKLWSCYCEHNVIFKAGDLLEMVLS